MPSHQSLSTQTCKQFLHFFFNYFHIQFQKSNSNLVLGSKSPLVLKTLLSLFGISNHNKDLSSLLAIRVLFMMLTFLLMDKSLLLPPRMKLLDYGKILLKVIQPQSKPTMVLLDLSISLQMANCS